MSQNTFQNLNSFECTEALDSRLDKIHSILYVLDVAMENGVDSSHAQNAVNAAADLSAECKKINERMLQNVRRGSHN